MQDCVQVSARRGVVSVVGALFVPAVQKWGTGDVLCNGGAVSGDGARVHDECDGFGVGHVFVELVADAGMSGNVGEAEALLAV